MAIMSKIKIVLFAADPHSAPQNGGAPRLLLDEEVRRNRQAVRASGNQDALEFDVRLAARTSDLMQALNETRPRVVHFSGHGGDQGLVLVGADGHGTRCVDADALGKLFQLFRKDVRLVVLNACFSLPQAEAIAEVVGCAIGTPRAISDPAAITFGSTFYGAIASGESVKAAYDHACLALSLERFSAEQRPQLLARRGVNPARLVLAPRPRRPMTRRGRLTVAGLAVAGVVASAYGIGESTEPVSGLPRCSSRWGGFAGGAVDWLRAPAVFPATGNPSSTPPDLASAKVLQRAGNHAAALPLFRRAVESGNHEAMGLLGIAHLHGQGTAPRPDSALHWLRKAAYKRDARAMTALAVAYWNGEAGPQSRSRALEWLQKAVDQKEDPEAMRTLAGIYRTDHKYGDALHLYGKAVRSGSVDARVDAGVMYEEGQGIDRDLDEARCFYRTAAEGGSHRGMLAMGRLYQYGIRGRPDYARAKDWYEKAVHAGSADAMNRIGLLYLRGQGVKKNKDEAVGWFRKARDAGSTIGAANLRALGVN
jgi:TPR repeat protein